MQNDEENEFWKLWESHKAFTALLKNIAVDFETHFYRIDESQCVISTNNNIRNYTCTFFPVILLSIP